MGYAFLILALGLCATALSMLLPAWAAVTAILALCASTAYVLLAVD